MPHKYSISNFITKPIMIKRPSMLKPRTVEEFNKQKIYLGGSKNFDETTGRYNKCPNCNHHIQKGLFTLYNKDGIITTQS